VHFVRVVGLILNNVLYYTSWRNFAEMSLVFAGSELNYHVLYVYCVNGCVCRVLVCCGTIYTGVVQETCRLDTLLVRCCRALSGVSVSLVLSVAGDWLASERRRRSIAQVTQCRSRPDDCLSPATNPIIAHCTPGTCLSVCVSSHHDDGDLTCTWKLTENCQFNLVHRAKLKLK